jgi:acyl-homoserine lactone acylase PvdQ
MDEETFLAAPYTPQDRQHMLDQLPRLYGADGQQIVDDITAYVAGVNQYISEAKLDPTKLPAEYPASSHPEGPRDWTPVDVLDVATLIGSQLGNGGGNELEQAERLIDLTKRFGAKRGYRLWRDLRSTDDPEAPVTASRKRGFPYDLVPKALGRNVALPDDGTLKPVSVVAASTGSGHPPGQQIDERPHIDPALFRFPSSDSNALLVSAKHSQTGHPLAVMGSQAAYFSAEIWRYQDLHGPGIDVAGGNIPGTGPFVEIGHGPDYAWSATSASQDIIDVYAVPTCQDDVHYLYRGTCLAMEPIEQSIAWNPSAADSTASGSETLRVYRTKLGIVIARAKVKGVPVVYTELRSTYNHELDSAVGFLLWNEPGRINSAADFQHAASLVGYTFNWFYTDDRDIAYINTGANPIRRPHTNGLLPQVAKPSTEWVGFDPVTNLATYQAYKERPQAVNQPYLVSWNNQQARHCCGNGPYTPVWRSMSLTEGIDAALKRGHGKLALGQLVDAAEHAATVDLRGTHLLPVALKLLGRPKDPDLAHAAATLRAWVASGAQRIDRDRDGHYDQADAVRIMDAWITTLPKAVFAPRMGDAAFKAYDANFGHPDIPNSYGNQKAAHLGSSWEDGWFGFLNKDLRTVLNRRKVKGRYSVTFCGKGSRARCRAVLASSLKDALAIPASKLYGDDATLAGKCGNMDQQACYDAIAFRAVTAVVPDPIPWQNRPTQQQVVEVTSHRPR